MGGQRWINEEEEEAWPQMIDPLAGESVSQPGGLVNRASSRGCPPTVLLLLQIVLALPSANQECPDGPPIPDERRPFR